MADQDQDQQPDAGRVLVQICIECGKEYMYDTDEPPDDLTCEKCGSTVFRSFYSDSPESEASADFRETTERDTGTTDSATDVARGDLDDLSNA